MLITFYQEVRLPVKAGDSLDLQRLIAVIQKAKELGADMSTLNITIDQLHTRSWVVFIPFPAKMDARKWMPHKSATEAEWMAMADAFLKEEFESRPKKIPLSAQKKVPKVEEVAAPVVEAAPEVLPEPISEPEVIPNG